MMTLLKSDLREEYPLMTDVYLLNSLSTFEAAAPALLVRSPAAPVICEFRPETAELMSEGIFEMAESTFERIDEGALVIALIPELISPITLVAPAATEVTRLLRSVRLREIVSDITSCVYSCQERRKENILSGPSNASGQESSGKKFELHGWSGSGGIDLKELK